MKAGKTNHIRSSTGTWKPAECLKEVAAQLHEILVDGAVRRQNRKDMANC